MSDAAIYTLIGGLLSSIPTIIIVYLNQRAARKTAFETAAFTTALDTWKIRFTTAMDLNKTTGRAIAVGAVHKDMVFMLLLMESVRKGKLTESTAEQEVERIAHVVKSIDKAINKE